MYAENSEHHSMILDGTDSSGVEEWFCPVCGRRLLVQWPPNYKKIVLEPGDDSVLHSGATGGVSINSSSLGAINSAGDPFTSPDDPLDSLFVSNPTLTQEDETRLSEWEEMLERVNFEAWWA